MKKEPTYIERVFSPEEVARVLIGEVHRDISTGYRAYQANVSFVLEDSRVHHVVILMSSDATAQQIADEAERRRPDELDVKHPHPKVGG